MFILSVAAVWSVAVVTPGPSMFVIVRCALGGDRLVALFAVLGTVSGTLCWGLAGWLGIGALFLAAPLAYTTLKIAGGLYLVWLGTKMLLQLRKPKGNLAEITSQKLSRSKAWQLAFATNIANPKTALFVASLFAATMSPSIPWSNGLAAVLVMAAISIVWYGGLVIALGHRKIAYAYQRARKAIDAFTGVIFVGFGLKLALSER